MGIYTCLGINGVLVMSVMDAIKSGYLQNEQYENPDFRRIQEIQDFLEICLAHQSSSAYLSEILTELACNNNVSIDTVKIKLVRMIDAVNDLSELNKQVDIHKSGLDDFLKSSAAIFNDPSVSKKNKDRQYKLAESYFNSFFEALAERNLFMNELMLLYWSYLPQELQQPISSVINYEIESKKNRNQGYSSLSVAKYYDSIDLLETNLSRITSENLGKASWQLDIDLSIPKKIDEIPRITNKKIKYESKIPKGYTLEDMLNGVSSDSRYEEIDWGKPVGKEIW